MKVSAIIPFFGGTSSATHSQEETRLDYLRQTLESLDALDIAPTVFQASKDKVDVPGSIRLDIDPIWLPYAACHAAQLDGILQYEMGDLVYVTEADQVLHVHDEGVYEIPNDEQYLAPWRLDLVGPNGECELHGSAQLEVNGFDYAIANGGHHILPDGEQWGTVDIHSQQQAFSGAYFCTRAFFQRIKFRKRHVFPVEHATGFDAKSTGDCVKTTWVERCWIDHLSPRDRFQESAET